MRARDGGLEGYEGRKMNKSNAWLMGALIWLIRFGLSVDPKHFVEQYPCMSPETFVESSHTRTNCYSFTLQCLPFSQPCTHVATATATVAICGFNAEGAVC